MAEFYAIKHPEGEVSDFARSERAAINRFLRRQDNWDSLWVDWLSQGYSTSPVNLPREEAERLNREMDYYRDSTRPVKIRNREPLPWSREISQSSSSSILAAEEPVALQASSDFSGMITAASENEAGRGEDLQSAYVDEFDEVSTSRVVKTNALASDSEGIMGAEDEDEIEEAVSFSMRADPSDRIGSESVDSDFSAPDVVPIESFSETEESEGACNREENKELLTENDKGFLDIASFLARNRDRKNREEGVSSSRDADLMRPKFVAAESDEDYLKARAEEKSKVKIAPVVDLSEYEIAAPSEVDGGESSWEDNMDERKVAFNASEDPYLSAPRIRETPPETPARPLIDDFADELGELEQEEEIKSEVSSSRFGDLVGDKEQVRVRPAIAGRRSVALPTKSAKKYTLDDD